MTVAELIALLQKADPSIRVVLSTLSGDFDIDAEFTGTVEGYTDEPNTFWIEAFEPDGPR